MNGCCVASLGVLALLSLLVLVWLIVPTEQTVGADFPNVLFLRGFGFTDLDPISHDNATLPTISAAEAAGLNGLYQFDPLFYHKSLDRFVKWEQREKTHIFSCTLGCRAMNTTANEVRLALVHTAPEPKKHLWYLLEMRDDDANSPILYARSKFRKAATHRSPWVSVTPGGNIKARDLGEVYIVTAWDAFRFDTPLKWAVTIALVVGTSFLCWYMKED
mmetsp:Transcript_70924/g.197065  ORF Transcript_70924/g.197065 Transcript_70924/m.197065 type:complete len:218 (+) Transcript_70924:100-753(+)|eukprot:CAMPEP_0117514220 /NCGR_PEP_ID=MMETSP0784-20121206/29957_1 /TAXON_ID=39447 /ORGANISM="" /LENGTH=217 /DNA_ID=CAMNT_0005310009 /DNA_START=47 /DNA_END=700 /DNA_ORIENTATION=+